MRTAAVGSVTHFFRNRSKFIGSGFDEAIQSAAKLGRREIRWRNRLSELTRVVNGFEFHEPQIRQQLDVLRSAPKLLADFRPMIITEYSVNTWASFDVTHGDLKELAQKFKYSLRLFDPQSQKLVSIGEDVWQYPYVNVVMIPDEHVESSLKNSRSH